jgi:membrane protein
MTLRRLPARTVFLLRNAFDSLLRTAGTRSAAQVAYFVLMSFPAILLLLVWGFSTVLGDDSVRESIVDAIVQALPLADPTDRRLVEQLLDEVAAGAGSLGWLGAISLLYSASGAIGAFRHAVNEARGVTATRPYVPGKALDVGLTLVVAPAIIVALGLTLSGALAENIGDNPWTVAVAQFLVTDATPVAIVWGLLLLLLRVLPEEGASFSTAWPGALAGAAGAIAVGLGTDVYFAVFGEANAIYGTLGALLAIVFSVYLAAIALVYGAHVAAQAALFPSGAAIDRELEKGDGTPLGRLLLEELRGLFVRARRP